MSGPITPPLTVEEIDGSPEGRPITTIKVSNGDLTISGRTATIDTSGSATTPGTPAKAVQFNSDPAGTFTGSAQLLYETGSNAGRIEMSTGLVATQAEIRTMTGRGLQLSATDTDESIRTQVVLFGEADTVEGVGVIHGDSGYLWGYASGTSTPFDITTGGASSNLILTTNNTEDKAKITLTAGAGGGVVVQTDNAGVLQLTNTTTDADSIFTVSGNGTGTPKVKLENGSMAVQTICEANKKFTIEGGNGGDTFVFDVSSASGAITWPDGTSQSTASSGGGVGVALPNIGGSAETMYLISNSPVWGTTDVSTTQSVAIQNKPTAFPFIAPKTGDLTAMLIQVTSGYASNAYVAVYSADSDNLPSTLLGYTTIDVTSTGQIEQTSFSSTVSLEAGSLYYFSLSIDGSSTAVLQATDNVDVPNIGIGSTLTEASIAFYDNSRTSYDVPPATYTASLAVADNRAIVGVKY